MSCVRVFDLPASETRIEELRKITEKPDFWGSEGSQEVTRELSRLQNKLDKVSEMSGELDEISADSGNSGRGGRRPSLRKNSTRAPKNFQKR